ncbi:MAG: hypothetical protein P8M20_06655 [Planctomycetaceae bacterium]|nr:hypothetical protein [Planctomycetaceae bacterium]
MSQSRDRLRSQVSLVKTATPHSVGDAGRWTTIRYTQVCFGNPALLDITDSRSPLQQ